MCLYGQILSSHEDLDWHAIDKGWIVQHFDDSLVTKVLPACLTRNSGRLQTLAMLLLSAASSHTYRVYSITDIACAQLFGYGHMSEYYEEARMVAYVPRLRTPALFLVSADDPFLGSA